jgi:hypothetical protein
MRVAHFGALGVRLSGLSKDGTQAGTTLGRIEHSSNARTVTVVRPPRLASRTFILLACPLKSFPLVAPQTLLQMTRIAHRWPTPQVCAAETAVDPRHARHLRHLAVGSLLRTTSCQI